MAELGRIVGKAALGAAGTAAAASAISLTARKPTGLPMNPARVSVSWVKACTVCAASRLSIRCWRSSAPSGSGASSCARPMPSKLTPALAKPNTGTIR